MRQHDLQRRIQLCVARECCNYFEDMDEAYLRAHESAMLERVNGHFLAIWGVDSHGEPKVRWDAKQFACYAPNEVPITGDARCYLKDHLTAYKSTSQMIIDLLTLSLPSQVGEYILGADNLRFKHLSGTLVETARALSTLVREGLFVEVAAQTEGAVYDEQRRSYWKVRQIDERLFATHQETRGTSVSGGVSAFRAPSECVRGNPVGVQLFERCLEGGVALLVDPLSVPVAEPTLWTTIELSPEAQELYALHWTKLKSLVNKLRIPLARKPKQGKRARESTPSWRSSKAAKVFSSPTQPIFPHNVAPHFSYITPAFCFEVLALGAPPAASPPTAAPTTTIAQAAPSTASPPMAAPPRRTARKRLQAQVDAFLDDLDRLAEDPSVPVASLRHVIGALGTGIDSRRAEKMGKAALIALVQAHYFPTLPPAQKSGGDSESSENNEAGPETPYVCQVECID
jgi:hypothetical protein